MLKLVICLSFLAVVSSYDFKDPYYNEILLADLLDSDDSLTAFDRFKRSTNEITDDKCKRQHKHKCCNDANGDNLDMIKELKKQCFTEIKSKERTERGMMDPIDMFSCEKVKRAKEDMICALECVGRKKNVVDAKGNLLDPAVLIPFVKENFASDPWQEPLIAGTVDDCLREVAEKNEKAEETRCNPSSAHFGYCMWRQFTLACPKGMQEASKKCDKVREKLANNEPVSMYHKHDFDDN
ncbi:uncharacterized protein LOC131689518 [Topomyia yanbarensis]|uniref:uncharacterized protein LOC131689518 n=1 Tax=Topomyia yanbarensis TaxID=2498891 RepID=UPI00273C4D59|nr:uncharacterized protein LOC131689518 [Topomyia yanbarensis]